MSTHTPGPWKVEVWDYSHATRPRRELNVQTESNLIATVAWDEGKDNPYTIQHDEAMANARLIAAAPDMLAALRTAEAWVDQQGDMPGCRPAADSMLRVIREAILKTEV